MKCSEDEDEIDVAIQLEGKCWESKSPDRTNNVEPQPLKDHKNEINEEFSIHLEDRWWYVDEIPSLRKTVYKSEDENETDDIAIH